MASAKPAQARKRKAASALRELGAELAIASGGRNYDLVGVACLLFARSCYLGAKRQSGGMVAGFPNDATVFVF